MWELCGNYVGKIAWWYRVSALVLRCLENPKSNGWSFLFRYSILICFMFFGAHCEENPDKLSASLYFIITLSKRFSKTLICRISGDVSLECILKDGGRICNTWRKIKVNNGQAPSKKLIQHDLALERDSTWIQLCRHLTSARNELDGRLPSFQGMIATWNYRMVLEKSAATMQIECKEIEFLRFWVVFCPEIGKLGVSNDHQCSIQFGLKQSKSVSDVHSSHVMLRGYTE